MVVVVVVVGDGDGDSMFQYVARPFHSQKEVCGERWRGRVMEVGGR